MRAVVPPGVEPGGLFTIQTPSGDMLQVTCPPGASAGQQIQVAVPARAGSESAPPVPAQIDRSAASARATSPRTPPPPPSAVPATAADLQMALDKLGASIQGFIFHAMHKPTVARSDGRSMMAGALRDAYEAGTLRNKAYTMTYTEEVRDLRGTLLATIRCSCDDVLPNLPSEIFCRVGTAQIVAADGSTIASVKTTIRGGAECNVGGGLYAIATLEGCPLDPQDRGFLSSFASKVTLTRHDGSGGLKVAERKSSKGYYLVVGAIVGIATLCVGQIPIFMMAHHSPAVYGLTSPDGALRFPPLVCSGSSSVAHLLILRSTLSLTVLSTYTVHWSIPYHYIYFFLSFFPH